MTGTTGDGQAVDTRCGGPGATASGGDGTALAEALAEATARNMRLARHLAYLLERSIVEALLFDRHGVPHGLLRRLVFHRDGKVRRRCRGLVFGPDGTPRRAWRLWIGSPAYRALPKAQRMQAAMLSDPAPGPSPRTAHFLRLLASKGGSGRPVQ